MVLSKKEYKEMLSSVGWNSSSFVEIASCLMKNVIKQMYHSIIHEDDISSLFWWC